MTADESTAVDLPEPEFPTDDALRAYGALAFLYMRSPRYANWPFGALRLLLQPPIDLRQTRLFNHDGIPRAACIWANFSPEAEENWVNGNLPQPTHWRSGKSLWLMDIVAPYGQGSGGQVLRAFMRDLPEKITRFRYQRVDKGRRPMKIVEINRREGGGWHAPVVARTLKELNNGRH